MTMPSGPQGDVSALRRGSIGRGRGPMIDGILQASVCREARFDHDVLAECRVTGATPHRYRKACRSRSLNAPRSAVNRSMWR